jgi:hypothetical protein
VIPRAYITAWRASAPWATDVQVEQDLVLARTIVSVFADANLSDLVAFRGGTALHKLFLRTPARIISNPASRPSTMTRDTLRL